MGAEHAPDILWRAQELYCVERRSFAAVAETLGVADSTVRRWADKYKWRAEREAIAKAESEIRANTVKSRAFVLRKLLESESGKEASQVAFAVASLERLALETAKMEQKLATEKSSQDEKRAESAEAPAQEASFLPAGLSDAERITLLEEAVNRQIGHILSNPVPDMAGRVKDIKATLDVIAAIKGKDDTASGFVVEFAE